MTTTKQILIRFDIGGQHWMRNDQPLRGAWSDAVFRALVARDFPHITVRQDGEYRLTIRDGRPVAMEEVVR